MKKRLLITSIVMMLVVAVALSTATYAWFTQNAAVTASSVTMTAGVAEGQSISIGWLGSEIKGTTLSATAGTALQPMAPTTDFTGTTAETAAWNGAYVKVDGKFESAGETQIPYTWTNGTVSAFYINNDSNSQAVTIKVSVADISNSADPVALADNTILEGGKVYYRKSSTTYTRLVEGVDYTANVSKVTDTASNEAGHVNTGLATGTIYATKGVQDYVRIAVFATTTQASPLSTPVVPANYSYKGLLEKTAATDTVYGSITANAVAADMSKMQGAAGNVVVIENLPALNRVYVIVKVWLDGAYFTEHESNKAANVSLTFSASNYTGA